jgi:hypothetical protein
VKRIGNKKRSSSGYEGKILRYCITLGEVKVIRDTLRSVPFPLLLKKPHLTLDHLDPQLIEELSELSFRDAVFFSDLKAYGTGYTALFSPLFDSLDYLITLHCPS